jgi:hypothetical protein
MTERALAVLVLAASAACASPVALADDIDPSCVRVEERLTKLINKAGKPAIVLPGAFSKNTCPDQIYWHIDQSRTASTESHVVVFGPADDMSSFLALSMNNAKIIKGSLPPEFSTRAGNVTANSGGATISSVRHSLRDFCNLPIDLPGSIPGSLWEISLTPVPHRQFCVGIGDSLAAFGIGLEKDGENIVGRASDRSWAPSAPCDPEAKEEDIRALSNWAEALYSEYSRHAEACMPLPERVAALGVRVDRGGEWGALMNDARSARARGDFISACNALAKAEKLAKADWAQSNALLAKCTPGK